MNPANSQAPLPQNTPAPQAPQAEQVPVRITGADALPTSADIAPVQLKNPLAGLESEDTLESPLELINQRKIVAEDDAQAYRPGIWHNLQSRNRLVLAVLSVVLIASGSFAISSFGFGNGGGKNNNQTGSNFANLGSGSVVANDKQAKLQINYDTQITEGRTLSVNGSVVVQNDLANGFSVQNASGSNLIVADTATGRVGIGQAPTGSARLQVNGDVSINGNILSPNGGFSLSGQGLTLNGVLVCTTAGCISNTSQQLNGYAKLNGNNVFTGVNSFTASGNVFTGDGSGLTALDAGAITAGTLNDNRLSGNVALTPANNNFTGANTFSLQIQASGGIDASAYSIGGTAGAAISCSSGDLIQNATVVGGIITSGSCVAGAGASTPTLQEVYDSSAPAHIVLSAASGLVQVQDAATPLGANLFEVTNNGGATKYFAVSSSGISITGTATATNFSGSGSGLTNVNAAQLGGQAGSYYTNAANISTGTLNDSRLSANVTKAGNTFNGASQLVQLTAGGILPVLNGSNLTSLNAGSISSGTLNDSRLSTNVALLSADNIFLGDNSFHLKTKALSVQDAATPLGVDLFTVTDNTGATKYFSVSAAGAKVNGNDICTTAGNCTGVSGGSIGGSGTAGKVAVFTGSGFTIGDSLLSQAAGVVTAAGSINVTSGNDYQINNTSINVAGTLTNVGYLDGNQTFSGSNTFSNSITAPGITAGGAALGIGASGDTLNLNGTYSSTLVATNGTNSTTIGFAGVPVGNVVYDFDAAETAGTYTICTTAGNCTGVSGGSIGGSGTAGKLAKFTGSGFTIGDSILSDNGTTVSVAGTLNATTLQQGGTNVLLQTTSFSGDVSGSYNSLSVDKLKGTALSINTLADTNFLVYNSSTGNWENHSISGDITVNNSGVASIGTGKVTSLQIADGTITNTDISGSAGIAYSKLNLSGSITNSDISGSAAIDYSKLNLNGSIQDSDVSSSSHFAFTNVNNNFSVDQAFGANLDLTGSAAFKHGTDYATVGVSNDVAFGNTSLVRLTGASAQTITGIAGGRDGQLLTIVNAGSQAAIISNQSAGSAAANRITTGTGADYSLPVGSGIGLIYDSQAGLWRLAATGTGINSVGAIDTQTASSDGAVIVGNSIYLQSASDTAVGLVNKSSQTFHGDKSFSGLITGNSGISVSGGAISLQGNAASSFTTTSGALSLQGAGGVNLTTSNTASGSSSNITIASGSVTAGAGASGNISIDVGTSTGTTGTISIGTANAGAIQIGLSGKTTTVNGALTVSQTITANGGINVAAGQTVVLNGGATGTRPASPTAGTLYFDTTTNQLIQYNGTKWVSDRSTATKIVAASNSTQAAKDAADYVATGTGDQATLNTALTAAAGGTVYLMEGTYSISASISVPNNTTLAGAGAGTVITIPNAQNGSYSMVTNSDTTTGTNVIIRDLQIDGNKANQSSGNMIGVDFNGVGSGTTRSGGEISGVVVKNIYGLTSSGIRLTSSSNNTLSGNTAMANANIGIKLNSGQNNALVDNVAVLNDMGIYLSTGASYNTVTGNVAQGSSPHDGIYLDGADYNTITGNTSKGNGESGIGLVNSAQYNTVSGNTIVSNNYAGVWLLNGANNNLITGNKIYDSALSSNNNGIYFQSSSKNNTITDNYIEDSSCTTTCYAINISDSGSSKNYLSNNRFSGSAANAAGINDAGTNTIYASQQTNSTTSTNSDVTDFTVRGSANSATAFQIQNASGASVLTADTSSGKVVLGKSGASGLTGNLQFNYTGSTGSISIVPLDPAAGTYTINLPAENGTICTTGSVCTGYQAAGNYATTALDNLSGVAINASLTPNSDNGLDLGTAANSWRTLYADTSVVTPSIDTGSAIALSVGGANATEIDLNQNTVVAAGKALTVTGGATGTRPASPAAGTLYYDTTTNQLIQYNGSKWVSDRSTTTKIVAASNSSQAAKDAADYVAAGTGDQATINNALSAAAGGTVYLMEGTYSISASISVPNNTTLAGAGAGTVITIPNGQNGAISMITNSDTATGTNVTIRDLMIDGNKANQTAGAGPTGVYFNGMGAGAGTRKGGLISNVTVKNLYNFGDGISLFNSNNNVLAGNTSTGSYDGILIQNSSNNTLKGNTVQGDGRSGIYLLNSTDNTLTGNIANSNSQNGLYLQGSDNTASGNTADNNGQYGIYMQGATTTTVSGNIVNGNASYGIYLSGSANNNTVTANTEKGSVIGIVVDASTGNTVAGNIANSNNTGIQLSTSANNNSVTGNTVNSNAMQGFYVSGSSNNIISGNKLDSSGGSTDNKGIYLASSATKNSITNNDITDTSCTTTCNAINISDAGSIGNYLAGNHFLGDGTHAASIYDATASGNIYSNQPLTENGDANFRNGTNSATAFQVQNAAGTALLNVDTSTPAISLSANTTIAGTNSLTVNGGLTTLGAGLTETGTALFKSNSATGFQVQDSSSSKAVMSVDTSADQVVLGQSSSLNGVLTFANSAGANTVTLTAQAVNPASSVNILLPTAGASGVQCLQSTAGSTTTSTTLIFNSCAGASIATLQQSYDASGSPQITLDSSPGAGGLVVQDNATPLVGSLFTVQSNGGGTKYLDVMSSGVTVSTLTSTGVITANGGLSVAANQTISMAGGATGSRPGSPTKGTLFYDTTTNNLIQYNGTKWISAPRSSTFIVAASNSTQAEKDAADAVATGTGDQATINGFFTTAPCTTTGCTVYLMEGTYSLTAAISVPNNSTLEGAGASTVLTIPNAQNGSYNMIQNTDTTTGTGVTIRDLLIEGNASNQTSGLMNGVYLSGLGAGSGAGAVIGGKIIGVIEKNAYNGYGIHLVSSSNNTITGNTTQGNGWNGIYLETSSNNNTVTGNTTQGNGHHGIILGSSSSNNTITGNTTQGNGGEGIYLASNHNTVTGNTVQGNSEGIYLSSAANNTIEGNGIYDNGGSTDNNGIDVASSDTKNSIIGNDITDSSCTATCYAININNAGNTGNYLASNHFLGDGTHAATINDATAGGNTYSNQPLTENGDASFRNAADSTAAFQVQNASGRALFTADTSGSALRVGNTADGSQISLAATGNANAVITKSMNVGGTVNAHDVVVIDSSANGQVKTTTTANDTKVFGIATTTTTPQDIVIGGTYQVNLLATNQAISPGDYLVTTTTAGKVDKASGVPPTGTAIGQALESKAASSGGTIWVYVTPGAGGTGTGSNLQNVYDSSTGGATPEIILNNGGDSGGIDIQDGTSAVSGNLFDVQSNGGGTNYFAVATNTNGGITLGVNTTVSAGNYIKITGSSTRPATPTAGMVYYDTSTNSLLSYNGSKWVSAPRSNTFIVAASNSTPAEKDAADAVATGTSDQATINGFFTTAPCTTTGCTVYLMEGTYNISAAISVPNNSSLIGAGTSTVITVPTAQNGSYNMIQNTDTATGANVTIRDLLVDGNKANQTSGNMVGIKFDHVGSGSTRSGGKIINTTVQNVYGFQYGMYILSSANSVVSNNTVRGNDEGIYIESTSNSTFSQNTAQGNIDGIYTRLSTYNMISSNATTGNTTNGILIYQTSTNNTITDNTATGNTYGIQVQNSGANESITGNTIQGNTSYGIYLVTVVTNSTISGNTMQGNGYGIYMSNTITNNTVTGNSIVSSTNDGIVIKSSSSNNIISSNTIQSSGGRSIYLQSGSSGNRVSSNRIHDSGGATANNAIDTTGAPDKNSITGNEITDSSCTSTCYAINLDAATNTYVSGNRFFGDGTHPAIIRDTLSTTNIYSNQPLSENSDAAFKSGVNSSTAFQIQNASGRALFTADTSGSTLRVGNTTDGSQISLAASGNANAVITKNMPVGGTVNAHDLVVIDSSTNGQVKTTTTANDTKVFGIATTNTTPQDIVISGTYQVNLIATNQAISPGDYLVSTTTAGAVDKASGVPPSGTAIGEALEAKAANAGGTIWVYVTPGAGGTGVGGSTTLQQAYDYSTSSPQITLDSSPGAGGLVVQDNATPLVGHNLFTVQSNGGGSKYLDIRNNGFDILGAGASTITTNSGNLTIDTTSGSTPSLNIGTGSQNKAIAIGNSQSSTTVTATAGAVTSTLSNTGEVVKTNTNSATAFQVQNTNGSSGVLLNADTSNMRISVGSSGTATAQLYVSGMTPTYLGQNADANLSSPASVYVSGRYAYVASSGNNKLKVYDVSSPASPTYLGQNSDANLSSPNSVYVSGRYAYVASSGNNKLAIYDVSNPSSPTYVASDAGYDLISSPQSVYVKGNYAYVTGNGSNNLAIFDISNPYNPTYVTASGTNLSSPKGVYIQGNYAYIASSGNNKLAVCNISSPSTGFTCNTNSDANLSSPSSVFVVGRYAYITGGNKMYVYDVSNPASPTFVAFNPDGNIIGSGSIFVAGRYAYIAVNNKLSVYDVSNPASPTFVAANPDLNLNLAISVYISGRYAFIASNGSSKLVVYDLGGTYTQQLEAGGAEIGTLQVSSNGQVAGDFNVQGGLQVGQNVQTSGDLGVAGSANITGKVLIGGEASQLAIPSAPTVTPQGATGSQRWDYAITAYDSFGDESPMSLSGTTSTGNSTLSAGNNNLISWGAVSGAAGYNIYRTYATGGSPSSKGWVGSTTSTTFTDTGINVVGSSVNQPQLSVIGRANFRTKSDSTSAFQIQNSAGSTLLNVDTTNTRITLKANTGIYASFSTMSTPSGLAVGAATSGGSLTASTTYFYKVTAMDSTGGETAASTEASGATGIAPNQTLPLTWTSVTGASGYRVYRSTTTNTEVYLTTVLTNSFTDTGSITAGTATPPSTTTAYTSTNNSTSSLQLSVGGLGTPTGQVYVSGILPKDISAGGVSTATNPQAIYVAGKYAYIASYGAGKFQVYDVSNPSAPVDVSGGGVSVTGAPQAVYVSGHYAYVGTTAAKLYVFDISNPSTPVDVSGGGANTNASVYGVYVQGRYAYVISNAKLQIFDVSNPSKPVDISGGGATTGGFPFGVYVQGNYAYVISNTGNTFQIFNVSNPASPTDVTSGGVSISQPKSIYVSGRYAYITTQNYLYIYDISKPSTPVDVTGGGVNAGAGASGLFVQGRYAYITDTNPTNKLVVFDISNPAKPVDVSSGGVTTATGATNLFVQGRYAYVVNYNSSTFQIFDLGGAYIQQLEAGGAQFGTLGVDSNFQAAGDASIAGGLSVGGNVDIAGNLGLNGNYLQTVSASSSAFLVQNSSNTKELALDTSGVQPILKVYDGTGTNFAQIYYSGGTAVFAASSGTTQIGSGSGTVTISLTGQTDQLAGSKSFTTGSTITYSTNDFDFSRTVSAGAGSSLQGSVLRIQDLSPTGLTNTANILLLNQSDATAGGYLINAQAAGSTVLSVDNTGKLGFWNGGNYAYIKAASGTSNYGIILPANAASAANLCLANITASNGDLQWIHCGGGSSTANVTLAPEFAGAVMTGIGGSNTGTMTSDYCAGTSRFPSGVNTSVCTSATDEHNYYAWTSTGANSYDIFFRWNVPNDFASFPSSNSSFYGWKTGTAAGDDVKINVYNNSSTACATQSMTNTAGSWQSTAINMSGCAPTPGTALTIDVHLSVSANANFARIGEIILQYNRK